MAGSCHPWKLKFKDTNVLGTNCFTFSKKHHGYIWSSPPVRLVANNSYVPHFIINHLRWCVSIAEPSARATTPHTLKQVFCLFHTTRSQEVYTYLRYNDNLSVGERRETAILEVLEWLVRTWEWWAGVSDEVDDEYLYDRRGWHHKL